MQLARLWREHLAAGCPRELAGVEIAGSDARTLDAEITACVSALICRSMTVDERIERRLAEISEALASKEAAGRRARGCVLRPAQPAGGRHAHGVALGGRA